jgi:hypothetical protein
MDDDMGRSLESSRGDNLRAEIWQETLMEGGIFVDREIDGGSIKIYCYWKKLRQQVLSWQFECCYYRASFVLFAE